MSVNVPEIEKTGNGGVRRNCSIHKNIFPRIFPHLKSYLVERMCLYLNSATFVKRRGILYNVNCVLAKALNEKSVHKAKLRIVRKLNCIKKRIAQKLFLEFFHPLVLDVTMRMDKIFRRANLNIMFQGE